MGLISPNTHKHTLWGSWEAHLSWTVRVIVGLLLPFTLLQFIAVSIKFPDAPLDFTSVSKEVAVGKGNQGRDDRRGSLVRTVCRILQWQSVRAYGYTPQPQPPSPSSSVPLHSIVFWASDKDKRQCFKNEQQPGAQTGWKRRRRERLREYCNHLVPLFSVWLRPPLWGFEIVLRMQQTWILG